MQSLPDSHPGELSRNEFLVGWRIVFLGVVGIATSASVAMLYAFGVLVIPLQQAFGWTRGEIQAAMTFYSAGSVVAMQLAGWLSARYGIRAVAIPSLVALCAYYLLLTRVDSLWSFYLGFTLITVAGVGTLHVTWTQLVALWFRRHRGLALAIILTGAGASAAILPSTITWAIGKWGWQAGFVVLAIPPLLLTLPLTLRWMKTRPASAPGVVALNELGLTFSQGIRTWSYWALAIAQVLVIIGVWGMLINTVPLMQDKGLSAATASKVFGAYGAALIFGRLFVGFLMDRLWAPAVAFFALSMPALGCFIFLAVDASIPWMVLATVLVGLGVGAEMDVSAFLVARYFGMRDYARLFGLHMALMAGGGCLAPFAFGALYDLAGSYQAMLWVCSGMFVVGPLMFLTMGRYPDLGSGLPTPSSPVAEPTGPVVGHA
jgi:MFS family permease